MTRYTIEIPIIASDVIEIEVPEDFNPKTMESVSQPDFDWCVKVIEQIKNKKPIPSWDIDHEYMNGTDEEGNPIWEVEISK
jgi:hypothetical protein